MDDRLVKDQEQMQHYISESEKITRRDESAQLSLCPRPTDYLVRKTLFCVVFNVTFFAVKVTRSSEFHFSDPLVEYSRTHMHALYSHP